MSDKIVDNVLNSVNNRDEVKENRLQRKAAEKSQAKAEKQYARMREDIKATQEVVMGPVKEQTEKDSTNGGTDFSLYNLILTLADFSQCATAMDSNRKNYECLYPHLRRLNHRLKSVIATLKKYELTEDDAKYLAEMEAQPDLDPLKMATEVLQKEQSSARQRSKM